MRFSNLDAFYHVAAKGNQEVYNLLYKEFQSLSIKAIDRSMLASMKSTEIHDDFLDYIDTLFLKTINDYDESKGTFSHFCDYIINHKIVMKINEVVGQNKNFHFSLDDIVADDKTFNDIMCDADAPSIQDELVFEKFKFMISSPKRNLTKEKRLANKIMEYRYYGYNDKEICKILKVTPGVFRGIVKRLNDDEEVNNFKLELK